MKIFAPGKFKTAIKWLWISALAGFFGFLLFVFAVNVNLFGLFGGMPPLRLLENPRSELASEVYTADGVLLGKYFRANRSPVEYEQVSPNVLQALLSAEDIRFYKHSGVDFKATLSLPYYALKGDQKGGSTLSQQVAKNLFATRGEAYKGALGDVPKLKMLIIKTKEWITAIQLERNYAKEEILMMYLNTVEFGSNALGIKVAAKTFFNKTPAQLTVPEAATLVGMVNAPSLYDPVKREELTRRKRNEVMGQMVKYGYLGRAAFDQFKSQPIALDYKVENQNKGLAPYFRATIEPTLKQWSENRGVDLYTAGLRIYTTLDSRVQAAAEAAVAKHMAEQQAKFFEQWKGKNPWVNSERVEIRGYIENAAKKTDRYRALLNEGKSLAQIKVVMNTPVPMRVFTWNTPTHEKDTLMSPMDSVRYYKRFLQTGFMAMDPGTGWVKAWVGGLDFKYFKYDHVKQGRRQPGSTFKPIVYATAIDNGFTPCTEVINTPTSIEWNGKLYTPANFDNNFDGEAMSLRRALARSINTVAAYLMREMGPKRVVDMARRLGITSPLDPVPSLALGTSDVSLLEMLGAYSTFVNGGTYTEPYYLMRIEDKNGNVLQDFPPKTIEALSEETAYLMTYMLRGAVEEPGGTSVRLKSLPCGQGNEIGGKTGTTQDYADGWFIGITHNLVAGIWVGGDEPSIHFRNGSFGQGGRVALPAWGLFMNNVYADPKTGIQKGRFKKPARLSVTLDCASYGKATPDSLPAPSKADSLRKAGLLN